MNNDKLKQRLAKMEAAARVELGDKRVDAILAEIEDESFGSFIQDLKLTDAQGRVLMLGDQVMSISNHFVGGEIVGVGNHQDGRGTMFVVMDKDVELHMACGITLQLVSRKA
jgi:hypothetical protein